MKISAHFNFADYWVGIIFRSKENGDGSESSHIYISLFPTFIIHIRLNRKAR